MQFNTDVNKQAQEEVFSKKLEKEVHPKIVFQPVVRSNFQKHPGVVQINIQTSHIMLKKNWEKL